MRTSKTFSVQIWIDQKKAKNGEALIYARVTVDQKRISISLKRKIAIDLWDANNKKVIGSSMQAKEINNYLELAKSQLYQSYQELKSKEEILTPQMIKDSFLGQSDKTATLQELIKYHSKKIERTLAAGTIRNFGITEKYINKFLNSKRMDDIYLIQLDYKFLSDFETFLHSYYPKKHPKAMGHNSVMKHIQRLRKMVTLAYHLEWIENDPFRRWKMTFEKKEREFLSENELSNLATYEFSIERLERVRDLFLFSCYTGISYIDLITLTENNIWLGDEGDKWIITNRQKTNSKVKIPLLYTARQLIQKYKHHPITQVSGTLFPTISNEKVNLYLKEIAEACGIRKNLTFHMARHTFATTIALSNGMPIETVSKILGHSKIATTQVYARVLDKKLKDDMNALQKALEQKKLS